ncbi:MAG: isochorismatase family protein [Bradyrhizobium sp.]|uniref:isochorismatase family protein n=1 Tax=Bradyrhizobium sp. TaxID=376 RepID=UPI0025C70F0E|nr:isochorismatase family protein [Bradyrhizobium sp.]MBI5264465.1 isochorismatase family protein [Bradyrhizobium sp.]
MKNVINLRAYANIPLIPTLVLLDLQQEYIASPRLFSIPKLDPALENCRAILAHARRIGIPVAFLRMVGSSPFFNPVLSYSHWIPGFEPLTSEMVFERSKPSCYANPEFSNAMAACGGHFVLAGFSGEGACLATALEAFHRGHRVTFLSDASASRGLAGLEATRVHETVVQLIGLYADVTTSRDWIDSQSSLRAFAGQFDGNY